MNSMIRRIGTGALIASVTMMGVLPAVAQATTARSDVVAPQSAATECGFMHTPGQTAYYNHCGNTFVWLRVEHVFGDDTYYCAHPGVQQIPQGNNRWLIIYADYEGNLC